LEGIKLTYFFVVVQSVKSRAA